MRLESHREADERRLLTKGRCFSTVQIRFIRSIVSPIVLTGPSGDLRFEEAERIQTGRLAPRYNRLSGIQQ